MLTCLCGEWVKFVLPAGTVQPPEGATVGVEINCHQGAPCEANSWSLPGGATLAETHQTVAMETVANLKGAPL